MKKLIRILAILLLLIVGTVILIPIIFKDRLVQVVKDNVNASLNAEVDFGDFQLSVLRAFPDLSFTIEDITVQGQDRFDTIQLAHIGQAGFTLDLMSVIKGEKMRIHGIEVDDAYLHALVLEDGTANYDIIKKTASENGDTTDVRSEYVILLEQYILSDGELIYDNRSQEAYIHIDGLNHNGNGSLTDRIYDLSTSTSVEEVNVVYAGITYLKDAEAEINANFDIQDDFRTFNLNENEIRVNQLFLEAEGVVLLPEDGVEMDIEYRSTETDLKNILSLVPQDYMPDLEGLTTEGKVSLGGTVKGTYDDNQMPGFSVLAGIADGRVQYPDLPEDIQDIQTDIELVFPGGADFDATTLDIKRLDLNIAESPIKANLFLKDMLSDPFIRSAVRAQMDLSKTKDAIALEGVEELNGLITADVDLEGRLSAVEGERYQDFNARGSVIMQDFVYTADSLPRTVVSIAHLNVEPESMQVPNLKMTVGKTDFQAVGRIDNYLAYALKDDLLKGRFQLQSELIDVNEFLGEDSSDEVNGTTSAEDEPMEVIEVPMNLDLALDATVGRMLYGDMDMRNIRGGIRVKEGEAGLDRVKMDMLGGRVQLDGVYATLPDEQPRFDFGFGLSGLSIPNTANTFNTVQTLAPVATQCEGDFSSTFQMSTRLDDGMNPIYNSLTGGGDLLTDNVVLNNFDVLTKVADALKLKGWDSQSLNNVRLAFAFEDGKVNVSPFDVKIDGMKSTIGGSMSFEQDLDYDIDMEVPTSKLGSDANELIGGLLGQANSALGTDIARAETIKMRFKVTGKVGDSKVKLVVMGQEGKADIKEAIVNTIQEEVEEKKEELIEDTKEEARKEAEKLIADAEAQADRIRQEASDLAERTRKQGEAAAKKIEDEAKNPLAKAAAKLAADKVRKEANDKATKIEAEADKQAQSLVDKAQAQADALLK